MEDNFNTSKIQEIESEKEGAFNRIEFNNIKSISFEPLHSNKSLSQNLGTCWRMEIVLKNGSYFVYPILKGEVMLTLCNEITKVISCIGTETTRFPHVEFNVKCDALANEYDEYCKFFGPCANGKNMEVRKINGNTTEFM